MSIILTWYKNDLTATQCSFRLSKGMGFSERRTMSSAQERGVWRTFYVSFMENTPSLELFSMFEKQTDSGWELLKMWSCFEILIFVIFVIQYSIVKKAEHRNIWASQICFLGKSRLVNYCLILRECLDSCFDRFLSVSFWSPNVQRCQIPNYPPKWNSKCSKVTDQKVRYLKSVRKFLSNPI